MVVDIVTPTRMLVDKAHCASLTLPASDGEIVILDGHTELLTGLSTGMLSVVETGKTRHFAVSHGFAEVRDNHVVVLAETCEEAKEIDVERAKRSKEEAEKILTGTMTGEEFKKYSLKLNRAKLRIDLAKT